MEIIIRRYIKFLDSLEKNKKPNVQALFQMTYKDARTTTGANIRHILIDNSISIIPGKTKQYNIYVIPEGQEWKTGLLSSLLEVRDKKGMILFNDEDEDLIEDELKLMIDDVCKN